MAWKEVDWSAWMAPMMRPVSCWGKKPLGTKMYRATVAAAVARVVMAVANLCRKTKVRLR